VQTGGKIWCKTNPDRSKMARQKLKQAKADELLALGDRTRPRGLIPRVGKIGLRRLRKKNGKHQHKEHCLD
jgi:hypothetical protein